MLALRSLAWTLLVPGLFVGYLPWRFFGLDRATIDWSSPADLLGLACIISGAALLGVCIFEFARSGHGTLSPVDPPRRLVVRGPYRHVRNPMYLSVTITVVGEALVAESSGLVVYWAVWFLGATLFVAGYEEPTLARQFGEEYEAYRRHVRRWIPRLRPWIRGSLPAPTQVAPADRAVFDIYPRTTTFSWTSVSGAAAYGIEVDYCPPSNPWCEDAARTEINWIEPRLTGTTLTFDFVGAQPGRWSVWSVDADERMGAKSHWRSFLYLR